jgi:glutathione peroxidase
LEIFAFPCRQFFSQELLFESEIKKEVTKKFKVAFPLFAKTEVNGENTHPIYKYLRFNSGLNTEKGIKNIPWNFTKFLVDSNGVVIKYYLPSVRPIEMLKDIEEYC